MIDVDFFKQFNDQNGHLEGDRLLFLLSRRILSSVRNVDLVSRYGGEEFALILPDTDLSAGLEVAERVRSAISNHPFSGPSDRPAQVTVSIGIASLGGRHWDAMSLIRQRRPSTLPGQKARSQSNG